jgi:HK97 family phage major capsid protein
MPFKILREEFNTLHKQTGDLITAVATAKRAMTAEETEQNDNRFARMDAIKKQIADQARFAGLALEGAAPEGKPTGVQTPGAMPGEADHLAAEGLQAAGDRAAFSREKYGSALNQFARTGVIGRELFAVSNATASGAYLPKQVAAPTVVRRLQNAIRAVLDAYGMLPFETDSLAAFSLPVSDDTANVGAVQSEVATSGTELDADDTGAIAITPVLFGSKQFWFSNSMVLAQSFDVLGYVLPMAQKRIEKVQETTWIAKLLATGVVGKTTAAVAAITYLELLDWEHSLAPAYRSDCAFIVSDSLYRGLRGLVDTQNRPIMDQDPTNVFAGKIHGKPVVVSDALGAMATGVKCGAIVSAAALKVVDVLNSRMVRYANVPQKPDQIGFEMFQNGDFGFVSAGVKLVKNA